MPILETDCAVCEKPLAEHDGGVGCCEHCGGRYKGHQSGHGDYIEYECENSHRFLLGEGKQGECYYCRIVITEDGIKEHNTQSILRALRRENEELKARVIEWVAVEDRLPEDGGKVLLSWAKGGCVSIGRWNQARRAFVEEDRKTEFRKDSDGVTHWAALPEGPKNS